MDLLLAAVISGLAAGALYGILGFAIVLLYKTTGIANFAQGVLGTVGAFLIYGIVDRLSVPVGVAVMVGVTATAAVGLVCYVIAMRPRDDADHVNLTMRTLGLSLTLVAVLELAVAPGLPYAFPRTFPAGQAFMIGSASVSWLTVGTLVVASLLAAFFLWLFRSTNLGLLFLGLADAPAMARLLGARTRKLAMIAWMMSSVVSLIVAGLIAPVAFLSTDMMDLYLLLAFTAAIVGGLTSLGGAFLGGALVGVLQSVVTVYLDGELAVLSTFGLLLLVLLLRPDGLFGAPMHERL